MFIGGSQKMSDCVYEKTVAIPGWQVNPQNETGVPFIAILIWHQGYC